MNLLSHSVLGMGAEYRIWTSRNKHLESSIKSVLSFASSMKQEVRLEMYNYPGLPYDYIEADGKSYDYVHGMHSYELYRRKDVILDMPAIRTIRGQINLNLMYRPILKIPVLIGANLGAGYAHSTRNDLTLVSKNNFNVGVTLKYSWVH